MRHLKNNANKVALIWEGDDPSDSISLTYQQLHDEVCKFSNVLKNLGVRKEFKGLHLYAYDS